MTASRVSRLVRTLASVLHAALRPGGDLRLDLFAMIFALGTLNHVVEYVVEEEQSGGFGGYMERWSPVMVSIGWPSQVAVAFHMACIVLSLLILALPWRQFLVCLLAVPYLLSQLASPSHQGSHNGMMAAALGLLLLLGAAEAVERSSRRGPRDTAAATNWCGWRLTGLKWICTLTYLFAAFHKLNTVFFWPATSPARQFMLPLSKVVGPLGENAVTLFTYLAIYGTVAIELSLPFLLMHQRTRLLGWIIGLLFHLPMLGYGVTEFTLLIVAFYPLFGTAEQARELLARCLARPSVTRSTMTVLLAAAVSASSRLPGTRVSGFHSGSTGLDPALLFVHGALLLLSICLWAHVTCALIAWLAERRSARTFVLAPAR